MANEAVGMIFLRTGSALFLFSLGYTFYYFFPRYFNYSKYKSMQLLFLFVFLILGILFLPTLVSKYLNSTSDSILVFIVIYDSVILLLSFYLFRNRFDSTLIFFVKREDIKKLISDVLLKLGWHDIQITEDELDSILFSDPNQAFSIQAFEYPDRFAVMPIMNNNLSRKDLGIIRKFGLNLKYDVAAYPEDKEMVKIFRQKHLRFLILSFALFFIIQLFRFILIRI